MITSDMVSEKLQLLSDAKSNLILKSQLHDPSNQMMFKTNKSFAGSSGNVGINAKAVGVAIQTITSTIVEYVEEMKTLPYITNSSVLNDRETPKVIVETGIHPEAGMGELLGENLLFPDILQDIPGAKILSNIDKYVFKSSSKILDENLRNVDIEIILTVVNPRLNKINTYRSGTGDLLVEISGTSINIDDIFIMRAVIKVPLNPNSVYDVDLSYSFEKHSFSGVSVLLTNKTIGDTSIGLQNLDIDFLNVNGASFFSMLTASGYPITIKSSSGIETSTVTGEDSFVPRGRYSGVIISTLKVNEREISVANLKISLWEQTGSIVVIHKATYNIYQVKNKSTESVFFPNLRPLRYSITEALNGL